MGRATFSSFSWLKYGLLSDAGRALVHNCLRFSRLIHLHKTHVKREARKVEAGAQPLFVARAPTAALLSKFNALRFPRHPNGTDIQTAEPRFPSSRQ